jgi:hypothetical protein
MTFLPALAEGAESIGESSTASAGAGGGSIGGLTGAQKGSAASKLLPKPKTDHPYIVGIILVAVGGFALIGSITGSLPSMIAALFVPDALIDASGNSASPSILHDITSVLNPVNLITQTSIL